MTDALICSDCGTALAPSKQRKGTRCKSCTARAMSRNPATRAKISAAMRKNWSDPDQRAARVASMTEANRRPDMIEHRRALGKALNNIGRFARPLPAGHPSRVQAGRTLTERRLAWCPPAYRPLYARLTEIDGFRAKEARAIVEDQIASDLAAMRKGSLSPSQFMAAREAARWIRERAAEEAARQGTS
ncbi:MAG: hypothetical protein APF82_00905 [Sphingomonadales bacterium BRH_c42]|nr:MAG: hypothetical protein APF82_00905 [Sphingomonadales bacterium BRH_c42]